MSVGIVTAGRAFGLGRTLSYELAKTGRFPCRVIRVSGNTYRVPRSAIFEALGVDPALTNADAVSREPTPVASA